jgi:hypothetical protein
MEIQDRFLRPVDRSLFNPQTPTLGGKPEINDVVWDPMTKYQET